MAIWRGAGGSGDATTDAANEASVASTKAAEAEASATAAASSATSAANSATTAINSKDAASTSESNAATSAVTATTQASNAATSASAASTSATAAQTAQTAAEAAKTAAETAETGAEVAKTAAQSAQTAAEQAQTGAETAETNAETAQAAAETALASTLSTLDEFDDIYLGAKASPPNTDNDGNTLQTGAIYWDTVDNQLYIWDGANWDAAAFNVTGAVTSFNTRTGAVTLQNDDITTAVGQSLQVGDSPTFVDVTATGNIAVSGTVDGRDVATDGTKLDGIEASATADQTGAEIKAAYELEANAFTDAQFTKLAGIEASATADQTAGEIKTAYESNADTNAFTDADHTKLDGIEANADVTDTTNVTAAGAVMDSELTSEASVKALDQGVATTDSPSFAGLTVDTDTLYVDSTNNRVGIGTSSPGYTLDVATASGDVEIRLRTAGTGSGDHSIFRNSIAGTTGSNYIFFGDNVDSDAGFIRYNHSNNDMSFQTNASEAMRIDGSGNVGIGTTSPANKLEVSGAIVAQGAATAYTNTGLYLQNKGSSVFDVGAWRSGASVAELTFSTDSGSDAAPAERMRIDSAGNVGIGETNPARNLQISDSGTPTIRLQDTGGTNQYAELLISGSSTILQARNDTADGNIIFRGLGGGSTTERMRINSSGNVGIGTNTPVSLLHVKSTIPVVTADSLGFASAGDGTGFGIYRSGAGRIAGYTWTITNKIRSGGSSGSDYQTDDLIFSRRATTTDSTLTEAMRITSEGYVGIGLTNPIYPLNVSTTTGTIARFASTTNTAAFEINAPIANYIALKAMVGDGLIFSTGNTERMRIDSVGRVTKSNQPAFLATISADQTLTIGSALLIDFDTEAYDVGSNFNTSTNIFTAPVTGKYVFSAGVRIDSIQTSSAYYRLEIHTSNRVYYQILDPNFSSNLNYITRDMCIIADMDAGDIARVFMRQQTGTASHMDGSSGYSWFSGYLLG